MMDLALWLAGLGHFVILIASVQVPSRLGWRQDLTKLAPLNRKLMWTYGGFTVLTILAFGTLTLALHDEFLNGDKSAVGFSAFIAIYWTARIVVDVLYFGHSGWPRGRAFVAGHVLLLGLFVALASTYLAVVLRGVRP